MTDPNDTLREELAAKVRESVSRELLQNGFTVDHLDYECTAITARHVAGLESVALDLLATNRAHADELNAKDERIAELVELVDLDKDFDSLIEARDSAIDEAARAQARVKQLERELKSAAEDIGEWATYASEYFREKHGLADLIAHYDAVLAEPSPTAALEAVVQRAREEVVEKIYVEFDRRGLYGANRGLLRKIAGLREGEKP